MAARGRKPVNVERDAEIRRLRAAGVAYQDLADRFELNIKTIWGVCKREPAERSLCDSVGATRTERNPHDVKGDRYYMSPAVRKFLYGPVPR